jgi:anti-sigma B factor antagonist
VALQIDVREQDAVSVVQMEGRLVYEDCQRVREIVKKLLAGGKRNILLDLEKVGYCDSAGLGCFASSFASVSNMEGVFKMAAPTPKVQEVLSLTRLNSVIEVHPTAGEALASFQ